MALGKGLDSLIQSDQETEKSDSTSEEQGSHTEQNLSSGGRVKEIDISRIKPNPHQPRQEFPEDKLLELVESIQEYGVVQPITLTPIENGEFELVAGERRLKATKRAGETKIPAIVKETTNREQMELALIENIQRHDLNPIEEAQAYYNLMEEFDLTQSEVAQKVGKSRSSIANILRLLELPQKIKQGLKQEKLSPGKARALLSLESAEQQLELFDKILKQELSAREIEEHTYGQEKKEKNSENKSETRKDPNILAKEEELESELGTKVSIDKNKSGEGTIEIDFYSIEELKRLLDKIN